MANPVDTPQFWEENYGAGHSPWDLGRPTPVFERLAASGAFSPGAMIVLGAGRGYDARLFAGRGFRVTAVDFAPTAITEMRRLATPEAPVDIVGADLFALPAAWNGRFDYVLEYTCFCAIDPRRREAYADVVAGLLKAEGTLIALAFPIGTRDGGPPYVVQPEMMASLFTARGLTLLRRERPSDSAPGREGIEELLILQKPPVAL